MGSPTSDDGAPGQGGPPPDEPTTGVPLAGEQEPPRTVQLPAAGGRPAGPGQPPGRSPGAPHPLQGAYGYGALPPDGRSSNRGLVIALIAGLVILAGLVVALIIAYTRDGGETVAADPSTSAAPSSSGPAGSAATRTDDLLAGVPVDSSAPGATQEDPAALTDRWRILGDHPH